MMHVVEYHEYIRRCSVHRGFQYKLKGFHTLYQKAAPAGACHDVGDLSYDNDLFQ